MSEPMPPTPGPDAIPGEDAVPDVAVAPRRGPSIVWLVPLVAAAIGCWLWYGAAQERGPLVSISLRTAEDLETGKTRVKFRNVDLGRVERIEIAPDLSGVVVTVQTNHLATPYLRDGTRFWVVRPRIGARGISGLGTLVSGAYIEMEPSDSGEPCTAFTGLEEPPVAPLGAQGLQLHLDAQELGSLDVGSGVFFKGVQVGQVSSQRLAVDRHGVDVDIDVEPQYAPLVHRTTRFWNASGLEASLGADGVQVSVQSLDALIRGGIAFETPDAPGTGELAHSGDAFPLYANRALSVQKSVEEFVEVVMYFSGSVRGLAVGAPVEYRGIRIGTVKDFWLDYDADALAASIPVVCSVQRGIAHRRDAGKPEEPEQELRGLVARGLRARLATGSLLTGSLFVDLDVLPDTPAAFKGSADRVEIPTLPSTTETLTNALNQVSGIVADLHAMVQRVDDAAPAFIDHVVQTAAAAQGTLAQATGTLERLQQLAEDGGRLRAPLEAVLAELGQSLRSLRRLTDLLERDPEALIRGKPAGDDR